jgi:hypothetical protein
MYSEVVIDTNIFVYAQNPDTVINLFGNAKDFRKSSREFLDEIKERAIQSNNPKIICVDGDWTKDYLDKDRSFIFCEYKHKIKVPGSYSSTFLLLMAQKNLIRSKKRYPCQNTKKTIQRYVNINNSVDCALVGVACSTDSKTLVSNEYEEFTVYNRRRIHRDKKIGVNILSTEERLFYEKLFKD